MRYVAPATSSSPRVRKLSVLMMFSSRFCDRPAATVEPASAEVWKNPWARAIREYTYSSQSDRAASPSTGRREAPRSTRRWRRIASWLRHGLRIHGHVHELRE